MNVESDGYGTGFVLYFLGQAGVPASDERIQNGIDGLKAINERMAIGRPDL